MSAYYNEHDPKAAAWLRELISEGHIAPGEVDERSILDVKPHELTGFTQQHFFAGIGGWSLALRLAGWADERPVRSGSCPCQPFSQAGQRKGTKDERHLWPAFCNLITFGEPTITFGEQVGGPLGLEWLSGVRADLEGRGYEVGAANLPAACVGAPHIRQRLFWMAHAKCSQRRPLSKGGHDINGQRGGQHGCEPQDGGAGERLGDPASGGRGERRDEALTGRGGHPERAGGARLDGMGDAESERRDTGGNNGDATERRSESAGITGAWDRFDIIPCRDGKARRVKSGLQPLAHGVPGRVGLLRGYGNAIVPPLAALFIQACEEALTASR